MIRSSIPLLALLVCGSLTSGEVPLGHRDFLPTPAHPVGWRGDQTGVFPGATFRLSEWSEQQGVLWKTEMPAHTASAPIVVGNRVFSLAEPHTLVCVDADSGRILWQRANDPLLLRGADAATAAKVARLCELARAARVLMLRDKPRILPKGDGGTFLPEQEAQMRITYGIDDQLLDLLREAASLDPVFAPAVAKGEALKSRRSVATFKAYGDGFKGFYETIAHHLHDTYGFWGSCTRPNYIDHTFATPVSDGQRVYAAFGQHQVACYDLDGTLIWAQSPGLGYSPEQLRDLAQLQDGATYVASPILVDGILLVQAGYRLRAFAAANGKILWDLPYQAQSRSYACGTGRVVRSDGRTVLVTVHGHVFEVATGRALGQLGVGNMGSEDGGTSLVGDGQDLFFLCGAGSLRKVRLAWDGDVPKAQDLWTGKHGYGGPTPVLWDALLYAPRKTGVEVIDAADGRSLKTANAHMRSVSPIIAGDRLVLASANGETTVFALGRDLKQVGKGRLDWAKPRSPWIEGMFPDQYAQAEQEPDKAFFHTVPRRFMYGHPFFHGDRMYVRSIAHLYCLGNR
jgi:outer membrane protein assembly factor BamB